MPGSEIPRTDEVSIVVHGDAARVVDPDQGVLRGAIRSTEADRAVALGRVRDTQRALEQSLLAIGARRMTAESVRQPLTWATTSVTAGPDWDHNGKQRTRRGWVASAQVTLIVRDFVLLESLQDALTQVALLDLHGAEWTVDQDNRQWSATREEAVRAALRKGRDYAATLGGTVLRVLEIADAGMLGLAQDRGFEQRAALAFASGSGDGSLALDPEPQRIVARIDARLVAGIPPLQ